MSESQAPAMNLNELLLGLSIEPVSSVEEGQFNRYLDLLLKWNARMNLTAVRTHPQIMRTHFVECIVSARALPAGVDSLLDLGSGAGFPGIPVSICRPEISVTLAESQSKKAAFLNEVVRSLGLTTRVFAGRAESIAAKFDCVTLRAVDRMSAAIAVGCRLLQPQGWLVVLTTKAAAQEVKDASGEMVSGWKTLDLPGSEQRILLMGQSAAHPA